MVLIGGLSHEGDLATLFANAGGVVEASAAVDSAVALQPEGWTTAARSASRRGRHLLHFAHRLPVESCAARVRFRQCVAQLFSAVDSSRSVSPVVEGRVGHLRPPTENSLDLADTRYRVAQSAAWRGKKPGKTPRIEASSAASVRCSPMPAEWCSASSSDRPMRMTSRWPKTLSPACRCGGPDLANDIRSICAPTRRMTPQSFAARPSGDTTCRTSNRAASRLKNIAVIRMPRPVVG
jgi:hypothetical protein